VPLLSLSKLPVEAGSALTHLVSMNTNQEHLAFYYQFGTAISDWQNVEAALYQVLRAAARNQPPREIFVSFVTHKLFRRKLCQIDDAIKTNFRDSPFLKEWSALKTRTDNAAQQRHKLAHGWVMIDPLGHPGRRWKLRSILGKDRQSPDSREILPEEGVLCVRDLWKVAQRFTKLSLTLQNFAAQLRGESEPFSGLPDTSGPAPSLIEITREIQRLANTDPADP
jgi:hypothetical protein